MNKHVKKAFLSTSAGALLLGTACGDDDNDARDLLVGEWDMDIQIDSQNSRFGQTYSYIDTYLFQADGTFGFCYEYFEDNVSQYKYCYQIGDWEWQSRNVSAVWTYDIFDADVIVTSLEFDGDSFEGDVEIDYYFDGTIDLTGTVSGTKVGDGADLDWDGTVQ